MPLVMMIQIEHHEPNDAQDTNYIDIQSMIEGTMCEHELAVAIRIRNLFKTLPQEVAETPEQWFVEALEKAEGIMDGTIDAASEFDTQQPTVENNGTTH